MFQKLKPYTGHIIALAVMVALGFTLAKRVSDESVRPNNVNEFVETSAMVAVPNKLSGGSGVILSSNEKESIVLTNKHVCEVIQSGGVISTSGKDYKIAAFKVYKLHDLCMVKVLANLKVNTVVAKSEAPLYSHAYVSGHPSLLPHIVTEGYISNKKKVDILVDIKECSKDDLASNPMECLFGGGIPVIKKFDAQLVTATIMPGSSGSAVFNEDGEIAGLIFAGSAQGLSYGFFVPLKSIQDFIQNQDKYKWRKPYSGADHKFFTKVISKKITIACKSNKLYSEFCKDLVVK